MIPYEKMIGIVFHSFSLVNKQQKKINFPRQNLIKLTYCVRNNYIFDETTAI